jgi:zinc transporter ZupT
MTNLSDSDRWGFSIFGCCLSLLIPVINIMLYIVTNQPIVKSISRWMIGFTSGLLLMTVVSQLFIDDVIEKTHSWEITVCFLMGFSISLLTMNTHYNREVPILEQHFMLGGSGDEIVIEPTIFRNGIWIKGIIINELIRNFCNGMVITTSFIGCSYKLGWLMTIVINLMEFPMKMFNQWNLIDRQQTVKTAFYFNILSTLPMFVGWLIINSIYEVNNNIQLEYILAFGSGTIIYTTIIILSSVIGRLELTKKWCQIGLFTIGGFIPAIVISHHRILC